MYRLNQLQESAATARTERQAAAAVKVGEMKMAAAAALRDFHAARETAADAKIRSNLDAERTAAAARANETNPWNTVFQLVDAATAMGCSTIDVTKYHGCLLQLTTSQGTRHTVKSNDLQVYSTKPVSEPEPEPELELEPEPEPSAVPILEVNQYALWRLLGSGAFGEVWLCTAQEPLAATGTSAKIQPDAPEAECAIKIIRMRYLRKKMRKPRSKKNAADVLVQHEIAVMKKLKHPNVCGLVEVIQDETDAVIYMVCEYLDGGSLEQCRLEYDHGRIPIRRLKPILAQVCNGLNYLHDSLGLAHCDLKPENIMLSSSSQNVVAKIVDFGTAQMLTSASNGSSDDTSKLKHAGTVAFYAPEMCKEDAGAADDAQVHLLPIDMWAFGVTGYQLAYGKLPFQLEETEANPWAAQSQMMSVIAHAEVVFPDTAEENLDSQELRHMLSLLLRAEPEARATASQTLSHPCFAQDAVFTQPDAIAEVTEADISGAITPYRPSLAMSAKIMIKMNRLHKASSKRRASVELSTGSLENLA
jgi:serine/threonine protein kinase